MGEQTDALLSKPCPVCGQTNYRWGAVMAHGIQYHNDDASFLEKNFSAGTELKARLCKDCGNIQLFAHKSYIESE